MVDSGDDARAVLERMRQAAIDQSADAMAQLYSTDAVHEFPFTRPDLPGRLEGRQAIMDFVAGGWDGGPLKYEAYHTLAIHDTADPATIVVEQEVTGTSATTGPFRLPNLLVLTVHDGRITYLRDYVNILAALDAMGLS
jgi:ketosteroid isomerase-like protein